MALRIFVNELSVFSKNTKWQLLGLNPRLTGLYVSALQGYKQSAITPMVPQNIVPTQLNYLSVLQKIYLS